MMKKYAAILLTIAVTLCMTPTVSFSAWALTSGDYEYTRRYDNSAEITRYTGSAENVTIPQELNGHTVTKIGEGAFRGCAALTSVIMPDSVTEMGNEAFANCANLMTVDISDNMTAISGEAFSKSGLTEITIPASVTEIGYRAFYECAKLASVHIEKGVTSIGQYAFWNCTALTDITIPESVTSIGYNAFWGCTGLREVTIPNSVTEIGSYTFYGCTSLASVTLPDHMNEIVSGMFGQCSSLTSITIPNGVTRIDSYAFNGAGLQKLTIPDGVLDINERAFMDCADLTEITIPSSVTYIEYRAFDGCEQLMIYGYADSYADQYARDHDIPFTALHTQDKDSALTDDTTGIVVQGTEETLPDGAVLTAKQTASDESTVTYEITLTKNGQAVQPTGAVTVKIPLPEEMSGRAVTVYRIEADGSRTDMKAQVQNGYAVFTTDHFSEYLLETAAARFGDIDGDGKVSVTDALAILRMAVGLSAPTANADMDGINGVTVTDALTALRMAVGLA